MNPSLYSSPLSPGPLGCMLLGPLGIVVCDDVDYTRFWLLFASVLKSQSTPAGSPDQQATRASLPP